MFKLNVNLHLINETFYFYLRKWQTENITSTMHNYNQLQHRQQSYIRIALQIKLGMQILSISNQSTFL